MRKKKKEIRGWLMIVVSGATCSQRVGGMREIPLSQHVVL